MSSVVSAVIAEKPAGFPKSKGCVGVTTFIKTELIADGHGRAFVPRVGGSRFGIHNGRRVDEDIRQWVDSGLKQPLKLAASRRIAAGLRRLGIQPLKAQVRVTDDELKLTTLIDLVGEAIDGSGVMWVVEVKATTLCTKSHNSSYSTVCRRTPMMRNSMPHTEQATHFLQAAFGAITIRRCYGVPSQMPIKACVLVATADACRVYECPFQFFKRSLFKRRTAVPVSVANQTKQSKQKQSPGSQRHLDLNIRWPSKSTEAALQYDKVLTSAGLVRKPSRSHMLVQHVHLKSLGYKSPPIGVLLLIEQPLHKLTRAHRTNVETRLTRSAVKLLATYPRLKSVSRLVLCTSTLSLAPSLGPFARS